MFSLIFGIAGTIIQYVMAMAALVALYKWASLAVMLFVAFLIFKLGTTMLETITAILKNKISLLVIGGIALFGLGGITGCSMAQPAPQDIVKEVKVQKPAERLRSTAIIKGGKTFYSADFINKYLEAHKLKPDFKNL